jgi:hypothetical protein
MIPTPKYSSFASLPAWAKNAILRFCSKDGETWVMKPVPALDYRTFIDVMNDEDGEAKAKSYFINVIGKFFPGAALEE